MVPGLDEDDYDEMPDDGDPYHATLTNECQDGNWPPRCDTRARCTTTEISTNIGRGGGAISELPDCCTSTPPPRLTWWRTLTRRGYDVRRDDSLIKRANAYS